MIKYNPDPHKGGYVYIPTRAVTAFFPKDHDISGVLKELSKAEFAEDRIEVFSGPLGELQLDLEGRRHGLWVRFVIALEELFTDEAQTLKKAEWYLQNGGRIVIVYTQGNEQLKHRAVEILKTHGGVEVQYWGSWVREFF